MTSDSSEFGRHRITPLVWEGDWDPVNARELFQFIKQSGNEDLFYGFELGNEVCDRVRKRNNVLLKNCNFPLRNFLLSKPRVGDY